MGKNMKTRARRIFIAVACATLGIPCALLLIPAPLAGYWHTPLSDCLCDSKNLLAFQNGVVYEWASGHGEVREDSGRYERDLYWLKWHTKKGVVEVRPGWFLMRIRMPEERDGSGGRTFWGYRELRPSYIKEVLNTKKKEPRKPPAGNTGIAPQTAIRPNKPGVPEHH